MPATLYLSTLQGYTSNVITGRAVAPITFTALISSTMLTIATNPLSDVLPTGIYFYTGSTLNWITGLTIGNGMTVGSVYSINSAATVTDPTDFTTVGCLRVTNTQTTLSTSSYVLQNSSLLPITAIGGSGGETGYYLVKNLDTTSQLSRSFTIYNPPTTWPMYAPINKNNLANVTWHINWKEILGDLKGNGNVKVRFLSHATSDAFTWATHLGSINANFSSNGGNNINGVNLGTIIPVNDGAFAATYLFCDTTAACGTDIILPNTDGYLTISFLDTAGNYMSNVPEYALWLYFEN